MASSCHRALLRGIPAIVLVAALALSASPPALARDGDRAALATERYYSSYGTTGDGAALAAERYYSSYGTPEPRVARVAAVEEADGGGPSWTVAVVGGVLLAVAAAGAGVVAGRFSRVRHAGV